jgi:hypothetical protein
MEEDLVRVFLSILTVNEETAITDVEAWRSWMKL